jgi:hypothetical protein
MIGLIAAVHAAVCWLVTQLTLHAIPHLAAMSRSGPDVNQWLVYVSKILYAPLITFGLYPRLVFPGRWIWIPVLANSVLWAVILSGAYHIITRDGFFKRRSRI